MKSLYRLLLSVFMVLTAMTASAFEVGNLAYEIYNETNRLVTCTGLSAAGQQATVSSIPGTVDYNGTRYRVYCIGSSAFANKTNLNTTFWISWGVKIIMADAFKNCTSIKTLKLASSVQIIQAGAFVGCSNLTKVDYSTYDTQPNPMPAAWDNKGQGITLSLPRHSTMTANVICTNNWANFTVDKTRDDVADFTYGGGRWCVPYYGSNEALTPSDPVDLYLVDGYGTGTLAPTNSYISFQASMFKFVYKKIVSNALEGRTNYTTIDLSKCTQMIEIGSGAFFNCSGLETLIIPKSVTEMHPVTFIVGCSALKAVTIDSDNQVYSTYDGAIYNKNQSVLYRVPPGKTGEVYYPQTLLEVGRRSHDDCTNITYCFLPYGVRTIGEMAFWGTSNLRQVQIPSSVTSLSDNSVFSYTNPNLSIWCNMNTPPTVTASSYFGSNSNMYLYVPYGKTSVYEQAGWTGFGHVNNEDIQAVDFNWMNLCYTVTSTAPTTVNDTTYDGRVKLVCAAYTAGDPGSSHSPYYIPAHVPYNGKSYAVTAIGEDAFNNFNNDFVVTGCVNVDTIGDYAFEDQPITSYPFTHTLKYIRSGAFNGAGLTGTVHIPYGVKSVGNNAFANGKYERIVVPSSIGGLFAGNFCRNTTTLKELIVNKSFAIDKNWNLGDVPSNCYIRVPVGVVEQYKQNSTLSDRRNYITAGAYDFAWNNDNDDYLFWTIISTTPTTFSGDTYDGEAKVVYHPNIKNATGNYTVWMGTTDKTVSGDERHYLITEIGDSCFAGTMFNTLGWLPPSIHRIGDFAFSDASITNNNLTLPSRLTYIGTEAFVNSRITGEVKIPASVDYIGQWAFAATDLSSLYFPGPKPEVLCAGAWTDGDTNPDLKVWVPNRYGVDYLRAASYWTDSLQWGDYETWTHHLRVYITPNKSSVPFSSVFPADMAGSGITAYRASAYDKTNPTQQLTMSQVNQAPALTGLILAGLTPLEEYRIERAPDDVASPGTNYLHESARQMADIYASSVGYYWDGSARTPHFVRPTGECLSQIGEAFLVLNANLASGVNDIYTNLWPKPMLARGDINGDGKVDVSDVNIIINIMLGKASASNYLGNADVNNDNKVDVSDVNIVINIMLGKE